MPSDLKQGQLASLIISIIILIIVIILIIIVCYNWNSSINSSTQQPRIQNPQAAAYKYKNNFANKSCTTGGIAHNIKPNYAQCTTSNGYTSGSCYNGICYNIEEIF